MWGPKNCCHLACLLTCAIRPSIAFFFFFFFFFGQPLLIVYKSMNKSIHTQKNTNHCVWQSIYPFNVSMTTCSSKCRWWRTILSIIGHHWFIEQLAGLWFTNLTIPLVTFGCVCVCVFWSPRTWPPKWITAIYKFYNYSSYKLYRLCTRSPTESWLVIYPTRVCMCHFDLVWLFVCFLDAIGRHRITRTMV